MKDTKKTVINPFIFLAIIPIGVVILILIYDFFLGIYEQNKLNSNVQEILSDVLKTAGYTEYDQYKKEILELYEKKGYNKDDLTFIKNENEEYIVIAYATYNSTAKEITNAFKSALDLMLSRQREYSSSRLISTRYIAKFNQYKEVEIEKYLNYDELEDEDNSYNQIIIN